jgi:hypothetical protein
LDLNPAQPFCEEVIDPRPDSAKDESDSAIDKRRKDRKSKHDGPADGAIGLLRRHTGQPADQEYGMMSSAMQPYNTPDILAQERTPTEPIRCITPPFMSAI